VWFADKQIKTFLNQRYKNTPSKNNQEKKHCYSKHSSAQAYLEILNHVFLAIDIRSGLQTSK